MAHEPDDKLLRAMGFGRDVGLEELADVFPQDQANAKWLLGMLVHYRGGNVSRPHYETDVQTLARALAASREQGHEEAS